MRYPEDENDYPWGGLLVFMIILIAFLGSSACQPSEVSRLRNTEKVLYPGGEDGPRDEWINYEKGLPQSTEINNDEYDSVKKAVEYHPQLKPIVKKYVADGKLTLEEYYLLMTSEDVIIDQQLKKQREESVKELGG